MSESSELKQPRPHILETANLQTSLDSSNRILTVDFKDIPPGIDLLVRKGLKVGDNILLTGGHFDDPASDKNAGRVKRIDLKNLIVQVEISD